MAAKRVWDYFDPLVDCPVRERIGGFSDGGKWVCKNQDLTGCIIYSFGSAGNTGFETEMIDKHGCKTFTFDPNPLSDPPVEKGMCYFKVGLGPTPDGWEVEINRVMYPTLSLMEIAKALNHSTIDILKMDIEGSEFSVIPYFLKEEGFDQLQISQIMVEIHLTVNHMANATMMKEMFVGLQEHEFYAFHKENNVLCQPPEVCAEYAFLHRSRF